jgi:hypothetical protein
MGWLRSRWTVVALVPAFFLAGFGIVAALAGGSDGGSAPDAGQASTPDAGETVVVTVVDGTDTHGTSAEAGLTTTAGSGTGAGGAATTTAGGDGGGDGGVPPAPPPGVIKVEYGSWDGMFELESPEIIPDFAQATVSGGLRYYGGMACPVGLVRVKVWLFGGGRQVGTTVWESTQSTGDGAEVSGREPVVFEAISTIDQEAVSAVVRFVAVECI